MSEPRKAVRRTPKGQRRPKPEDFPVIMDQVATRSLHSVCIEMGLHYPSTYTAIADDPTLRDNYTRSREMRAEAQQEEVTLIGRAAALGQKIGGKTVDPAGARVYLETIKWTAARMAPKKAPIQRIAHSFEDVPDNELDRRLAELAGPEGADEG